MENFFKADPSSINFIHAFTWMLIHSLWQGCLPVIFMGLVRLGGNKLSAAATYKIEVVQLSLFAFACISAFLWEYNKVPGNFSLPGSEVSLLNGPHTGNFYFVVGWAHYLDVFAPAILLLWLSAFLFYSFRLVKNALYLNLVSSKEVYRVANEWEEKLLTCCQKLKLSKPVLFLESGLIKVPIVLGHFKPMLLIPLGMLARIPAEQIEAVLLHELSHIKRSDYLVNILQTLMETIFFFNPGLKWLSAAIREEREYCCDDIALGHISNNRTLVNALITFKDFSLSETIPTVAFLNSKDQLLNRVYRLLNLPGKVINRGEKILFVLSFVGFSIIGSIAIRYQTNGISKVRHLFTAPAPKLKLVSSKVLTGNTGDPGTFPYDRYTKLKKAAFIVLNGKLNRSNHQQQHAIVSNSSRSGKQVLMNSKSLTTYRNNKTKLPEVVKGSSSDQAVDYSKRTLYTTESKDQTPMSAADSQAFTDPFQEVLLKRRLGDNQKNSLLKEREDKLKQREALLRKKQEILQTE